MKKVFISDLDGTLLNSSGALESETREKLNLILASQNLFTIATARRYSSVKEIFKGVNLHLPFVELNGCFVTDIKNGNHIAINNIDAEIYIDVFHIIDSLCLNPFVITYYNEHDYCFYKEIANDGMFYYLGGGAKRASGEAKLLNLYKTDDFSAINNHKIMSIILIERHEKIKQTYELLTKNHALDFNIIQNPYSPDWYWLYIQSKRATKLNAIKQLLKLQNLSDENVYVFGNDINDVPMLKHFQQSVAVDNADMQIKQHARCVIENNAGLGVVDFILNLI